MAVTLNDLLEDPALLLWELDGETAVFQTMSRETVHLSIFLDARIRREAGPTVRVPLNALVEAARSAQLAPRPIGWIFHVAQCGSTLLARALDHPGRSLVLREPAALRRLGVIAGAGAGGALADPRFAATLDATLALLGKRWEAEAPVVVKANVPVNFIADAILARDPGSPAIALYFPLESYAAAILRTEGHVRWTEGVFDELRMAEHPAVAADPPCSPAGKAAALWFAQMQVYEGLLAAGPQVRSLDAATLFASPAQTIAAAADLFGVSLAPGEAGEIAGGELFHSYSKNPALDYDPEVREAREAEALRRLAEPLAEAAAWARRARERHGLGERLARPLAGDAPLLLP